MILYWRSGTGAKIHASESRASRMHGRVFLPTFCNQDVRNWGWFEEKGLIDLNDLCKFCRAEVERRRKTR